MCLRMLSACFPNQTLSRPLPTVRRYFKKTMVETRRRKAAGPITPTTNLTDNHSDAAAGTNVRIRPVEPGDQERLFNIYKRGFMDLPEQIGRDTVKEILSTPKYLVLYMLSSMVLTILLSFAAASFDLIPKKPEIYFATVLLILFGSMSLFIGLMYYIPYWYIYSRFIKMLDTNEEMNNIHKSFSVARKVFLVAERVKDGLVLGCAAVFPRTKGANGDETAGEIGRVSVAPEARGQGVATLLMQAVEREAVNLGYKSLFLVTGNNPAKKMYAKLGYAKTGCVRKTLGMEALVYEKSI